MDAPQQLYLAAAFLICFAGSEDNDGGEGPDTRGGGSDQQERDVNLWSPAAVAAAARSH